MAVWSDLNSRLASGAAMALVGVVMIWLGGIWFGTLAALVSGIMVWELARMMAPEQRNAALQLGLAAAIALLVARAFGGLWVAPLIGAVAVQGVSTLRISNSNKLLFVLFSIGILGAGTGLTWFRDTYGIVWLVWLVLVVIATDVFGYFAGRLVGGPKFWPAISPKKTWSGTVAGWVAAALLGLAFRQFTNAGPDLPWISMALSMASQGGDMAESALKRRMGVKDSSSLIPGHGGLFDRFDGLLAGALFMLLVSQLVYVPEVRI
ncbi:phosphatidate cytidylyltransferase [Actibacterium mucosum KCTC 23349]|uniref:Phosphatidate cytidylyltransferase n=1 Tax=Actibacterium mucosum KCTC 23349 TaxID=1454373 RepID=A0A037ZKD4_9RHOB|nr:phosphatidate cytidylyltransferase [Actibacterium mucosum]KAJ56876.1 phosphatidate cytidylyltransferase [Actibacterium mucosum KCTC 23349]